MANASRQITPSAGGSGSTEGKALGILFVILGSASYGVLSTFVKLAYKAGFTTAEVTIAQAVWGAILLTLLEITRGRGSPRASRPEIYRLLLAGVPVSLTSILYYLSVHYIDASIAVILLMQAVWMGVVIDSVHTRRLPRPEQIVAIALVFAGTFLATNISRGAAHAIDPRGLVLALLAALSFSATMWATGNVAARLAPATRSRYMIYGGTLVVLLFGLVTQIAPYYFGVRALGPEFTHEQPFHFGIFLSYGFVVALFGTFIPPLMLNRGFPIVGVGLGSILSSVELPFAIMVAFLLLGERVSLPQWAGVGIILAAIVLLNFRLLTERKGGP